MNLPNALTLLRIAMIPVLLGLFYLPYKWSNELTALVFALAALTDWLDGYLARRLHQTSQFGAFLDPVADKLMVAAVLVVLVEADPRPALAIPAIVIISREIAVSALREFMAELGHRTTVAVASVGKVKTLAQMLALLLMLYRDAIGPIPVYEVGFYLLYLAALLTLWSMLIYVKAAWPQIGPRAISGSLDSPSTPTKIPRSLDGDG